MKRLLTLLLFSNLLLSLLQAQPVHQIRGTVIEKNSRQPLEFINVMVLGLNKGGVTNAEGHFTIEQVPLPKNFSAYERCSLCEAGIAPESNAFLTDVMNTDRKLTNGIILSAELNQRLTA